MVVSSFNDETRDLVAIPAGRAGSLSQTAGLHEASAVSVLPVESFGGQHLLGIHWRRLAPDATRGGEALRNRMLCT